MNQVSFDHFFDGFDDLTSNSIESLNYKVNRQFHGSHKNVAYVSTVLTEFRKRHGGDKHLALVKNDKLYLRLRSKKLREQHQERRNLVTHFYELDEEEQIVQLWTVLYQIGEMGAKPPRFNTVVSRD